MTSGKQSIVDKIWAKHEVATRGDGQSLLYIDRHFLHEGSKFSFDILEEDQSGVRRPDLTFAFADHFVPTIRRAEGVKDPERKRLVDLLDSNSNRFGVKVFGMSHPNQGIVHVVGPEQGLTLPGTTIVCGDSHTSTHGALGAYAFGVGSWEVSHVLRTQTLWQSKPKTMLVKLAGNPASGVHAKDVILSLIGKIGTAGGTGHAIEFAGSYVDRTEIFSRMTLCNMAIEAGARIGIVAPDDTTFEYIANRPFAPKGAAWERAVESWKQLVSDPTVDYGQRVELDVSKLAPTVTWGTSPETALPITEVVPDPDHESDAEKKTNLKRMLEYMDLKPGTPLAGIPIDHVFIGSCTNGRIEDLRVAASVFQGRKAKVPTFVAPGSMEVKRQAEAEGLDKIFLSSGVEWRDAGCSMCLGVNGDKLDPGQRCASTSNRNFEGRQGRGSRTHLVSPAMAAAAAVQGALTDVRTFT